MKGLLLILPLTINAISISAQGRDAILGKWLSQNKEAQIQIGKRGEQYFGKIIWLESPNGDNGKPKLDSKNPDPKLRSQPILGLEILKGFTYQDDTWENGTIYDPKSGKIYSCKMTLDGSNTLRIRGYIGVSLIGKTEIWTRVK